MFSCVMCRKTVGDDVKIINVIKDIHYIPLVPLITSHSMKSVKAGDNMSIC